MPLNCDKNFKNTIKSNKIVFHIANGKKTRRALKTWKENEGEIGFIKNMLAVSGGRKKEGAVRELWRYDSKPLEIVPQEAEQPDY